MQTIFQIIFARFIAGYLGKNTLLLFYRITNNKSGIEWLTKPEDEMAEITGGCLINIVGLLVFTLLVFGLGYIYYELFKFS